MPEPTETEDVDQTETATTESDNMRQLREAAASGAAAKRELAFVKAGLDTDNPLVATVMSTYKGDLTKDAVVAFATELGLIGNDAEPEPDPASQDEARRDELVDAHHQREQLKDADRPNTGDDRAPEDPHLRGLKSFREAMAEGHTREEAAAEYFGSVLQGAKEGDPRAKWAGWEGNDALRAQDR